MIEKKTARNSSICRDREKGMTYRAIADKHGISIVRAREIYEAYKQQAEFKQGNELYSAIADAASILNVNETLSMRLYNVLNRHGVNNVDGLLSVSLQELFNWRNAGRDCVALCAIAQEIAFRRRVQGGDDA